MKHTPFWFELKTEMFYRYDLKGQCIFLSLKPVNHNYVPEIKFCFLLNTAENNVAQVNCYYHNAFYKHK